MNKRAAFLIAALSAAVSACAVGPDYERPAAPVSATYKELGEWQIASPAKIDPDSVWWAVFNDPVLDGLEREVTVSNQTVAQSEAAYRAAVAAADGANATLFPTIAIAAGFARAKTQSTKPAVGNDFTAGASASWALDVWGKLRRGLEAAQASAAAGQDQLAAAKLSVQAALAGDYFSLRSADELTRLLDATVAAYEKSLEITRNQYKSGTAAKSDVDQAVAQLEATRAQALNVLSTRAQLEHAIAVLLGKAPADFTLARTSDLPKAPKFPIQAPSVLLERRPDVAAAERQMAAANAEIGVAIAAYFPDLTLSAGSSNSAGTIGQLFHASNNVWSFGPNLADTVIDWGARDASVAQARAKYDSTVAAYRQTVLTALQQVEDDLVAIAQLDKQAVVEDRAVAAAAEAARLIFNQYRAGTVAYTSVITAQTAELTARQSALTIHQNQFTLAVSLLQALGGEWTGPRDLAALEP